MHAGLAESLGDPAHLDQNTMTVAQVAIVALAGLLAGSINAIVGAGSLITFPTLLAVGLPPVTANVTNTVGLVLGNVSAVVGYRWELRRQASRAIQLSIPALGGSVIGAALLLLLPQRVFSYIVPALVAFAVVLVLLQPRISKRLTSNSSTRHWTNNIVPVGVFATAVYGGYFGAAQGVILISILTTLLPDPVQELNAVKNLLVGLTNLVAAVIFVAVAHVNWEAAAVVAVSSTVGGQVGSMVGRRMHPLVLRLVIVAAGAAALIKLLL